MAAIDELVSQLLTPKQAARATNTALSAVRDLIRSGELPSAVIGGNLYVARGDLAEVAPQLLERPARPARRPVRKSKPRRNRTAQVYAFVVSAASENDGAIPSLGEIGQAVGIAGRAGVTYHVRKLERLGRLVIDRSTRPHRLVAYRSAD